MPGHIGHIWGMFETGGFPMQWKSWLQAAAIAALTAGIFIADTVTDLEIAAAVFYIAIILLAVGRFPAATSSRSPGCASCSPWPVPR